MALGATTACVVRPADPPVRLVRTWHLGTDWRSVRAGVPVAGAPHAFVAVDADDRVSVRWSAMTTAGEPADPATFTWDARDQGLVLHVPTAVCERLRHDTEERAALMRAVEGPSVCDHAPARFVDLYVRTGAGWYYTGAWVVHRLDLRTVAESGRGPRIEACALTMQRATTADGVPFPCALDADGAFAYERLGVHHPVCLEVRTWLDGRGRGEPGWYGDGPWAYAGDTTVGDARITDLVLVDGADVREAPDGASVVTLRPSGALVEGVAHGFVPAFAVWSVAPIRHLGLFEVIVPSHDAEDDARGAGALLTLRRRADAACRLAH